MAKTFTVEQVLQFLLEDNFQEWWEEVFDCFQTRSGDHKDMSFKEMESMIEGMLESHPAMRPLSWGEASVLLGADGWSVIHYDKESGNEHWAKGGKHCILIVDPGSSDHPNHKMFTALSDHEEIDFVREGGDGRWIIPK